MRLPITGLTEDIYRRQEMINYGEHIHITKDDCSIREIMPLFSDVYNSGIHANAYLISDDSEHYEKIFSRLENYSIEGYVISTTGDLLIDRRG
jgi:hypothetical protein